MNAELVQAINEALLYTYNYTELADDFPAGAGVEVRNH